MTGESRCSEHPRTPKQQPHRSRFKYQKKQLKSQLLWLLSENMVPQNSVIHHQFAIEIAILVVYRIPHFRTHPFKLHPDVLRSTAVPVTDLFPVSG